jgi:hypothetical protein
MSIIQPAMYMNSPPMNDGPMLEFMLDKTLKKDHNITATGDVIRINETTKKIVLSFITVLIYRWRVFKGIVS